MKHDFILIKTIIGIKMKDILDFQKGDYVYYRSPKDGTIPTIVLRYYGTDKIKLQHINLEQMEIKNFFPGHRKNWVNVIRVDHQEEEK